MVDATLALPAETRLMVLAPVVRDRKGEFVELFEQMQAQGYVRFRVDGATVDAADVPKLKKAEKHDIDVVIDRIKVPAGGRRRRRRAAAPAPRRELRGGAAHRRRARARGRDGRAGGAEHLYSSKFACPLCDYSLPELEPRLFSFNSPVGACPTCDGLGVTTVFDAERVVAFPSLSLASGAVKGWDRRNTYTFSLLESVAGHYGFDLDTPFEELPAEAREVLLRGSGDGRDRVRLRGRGRARQAARRQAPHPFEGILPNLERRLRETDSAAVREELARLQSAKPCPDCHGTRLRVEARNVFLVDVAERRQGADLPGRALHAARGARLVRAPGARRRQGRDRRQGDPRDLLAPQVPERRRPQLPEPRPQRRDAVGRRGAADPARVADRLRADRRDVRARRAVDRPAPARQRAPDRHALPPARHRQQRASSSSTTRTRSAPPTTSSTWARAPASTAAGSWRRAGRDDVAAAPESLTGRYLSRALRIACRSAASARRPRTSGCASSARAATT